jgi:hypothetical protein
MLEVKSQMKFSRGEDAGNQVDLRCVCFALCVWWTRAYLCVRGEQKETNRKGGPGDCICNIWW